MNNGIGARSGVSASHNAHRAKARHNSAALP